MIHYFISETTLIKTHYSKFFLDTLSKIVESLPSKLSFGLHDHDDIKQQAYLIGLQAYPKWDRGRPLENFLRVHISNRLKNFNRDENKRQDAPCYSCIHYDDLGSVPKCNEFSIDDPIKSIVPFNCSLYNKWKNRQNKKHRVTKKLNIEHHENSLCAKPNDIVLDVTDSAIILDRLPPQLRPFYLKMSHGVLVPLNKRNQIKRFIENILSKSGNQNRDKKA